MEKYGTRTTKKPISIKLSTARKLKLDSLMESWDFETKVFLRGILQLYVDRYGNQTKGLIKKLLRKEENKFELLSNPSEFRNWKKRFLATGKTGSRAAYEEFLKKELSPEDATYLLHKIKKETANVVLPEKLLDLFDAMYQVHLRGESVTSKKVPKKPFVLVVGQSGSGKTATTKGLIESAIFSDELRICTDYRGERERISKKHPFLTNIPLLQFFKPIEELEKLNCQEESEKKLARYNFMIRHGLFRKHFGKKIGQLEECEERSANFLNQDGSMDVDYQTISADEVQTKWYGETGNKFKGKMGSSDMPSIRHILEAHSVLGIPHDGSSNSVQSQTLSATINKIMDEIHDGVRDCIFIADTHSPELIANDTYRRFDELGVVIDISKYWRDKKYLNQLIGFEIGQHNIEINKDDLSEITDRVFEIFNNKSLAITPAYVRKLVASIIEQKNDIKIEYFYDELLVRKGFENVARNLHGDLYKKIIKNVKEEDGYSWDDYEGKVKDDVLESVLSTLFRGGENKGDVLIGPAGSGKTFLLQVIVATHPEITYLSVSPDDLYMEGHGEQGIIKNIDGVYNIAKMLTPSIIVFNEADAIAKKRNTRQLDPMDRVTNKVLDILDGDDSVKGTYTGMTSNLFDNLEPALVRPGRLGVVSVDGKLSETEILNIIQKNLGEEPLCDDISVKSIYVVSKSVNNTPAGYVDFIRKIKNLRKTDISVIREYKKLCEDNVREERLIEYMKFNSKAIIRIIEALGDDIQIITETKKDTGYLFKNRELFYKLIKNIKDASDYPLRKIHLLSAKEDLLKNPQKKAFREYDDFLTEELSTEPQIGKIVGAAYGNNLGVLVPINTVLVPRSASGDFIIFTGATKGSVLQENDPSEMTIQSAKEAFALNLRYFETLFNKVCSAIDSTNVMGQFLENRSIHHQFETVNYAAGGPSAGFALAINTLSVLLNLPVYHDFGITGAPGIRGTSGKKAGSSVMIGGEDKKAERVLRDLSRMFVPNKNYTTIPIEHQETYWNDGKIIIPVGDYSDVIPEVLCIEHDDHAKKLKELNRLRIEYNKKEMFSSKEKLTEEAEKIWTLEIELKKIVEMIIIQRLVALYEFYHDPRNNKFANQNEIFKKCLS